jgi:hypothetical protein
MFQFRFPSTPSPEQMAHRLRPGARFILGYLDAHERTFAAVVSVEVDLLSFQLENKQGEVISTPITMRTSEFQAAIISALPPVSVAERTRRGYAMAEV